MELSLVSLLFYGSLTLFSVVIASKDCYPPECFSISKEAQSKTITVKNSSWTIFCYEGKPENAFLLWSNPVLKISTNNGTSESFQFICGDTPDQVEEKKESAMQLPQVLQNLRFMFNVDLKDMSFSPFNQSCIGIHSNQQYTAEFKYKRIELWYVAYLFIGLLIFLYAKHLSQNVNLQYGSGVSLGIIASLLILMIILHRVFPQSLKKLGYLMVLSSCCASMYFWQLFATSFSSTVMSYWKWILGYIAVTGFLSFGACYKYGPITDQKSLNILKWLIQALGVLMIYQGTQIPQISVAIIMVILTIYNLPKGLYSNKLTRYFRYRLFKPKVRLLTEEEYQKQGYEETKKALEDLRKFCQSPDCKPWKVISKLKSPDRFASFIEGDSWHVNDQELLEYDSFNDEELHTENEEEEEENIISEDENPE
ncbi:nuclear envelope integral membrane protein 1-like isoform X2 [Mytilus californianus]|uniref:nuclear envelope integral membrane protein 1-like isoform X2 n=1 Tax=Mytilus californianus TaxID=6549 RepID=UPI0022466BC5|nr:nuclear envelope integral membrane protein 1-like isoform X2 [Mytilus californianus]